MTQKINFKSKDNLLLSGIWHFSKKSTQKAIILAHGITVDKDEDGIFIDLAELLAKEGFAVFRFDFRGHGESEGDSVDMTITGELMDLQAAFKEVENKGYSKIGLLGASFGGGIATLFTANNPGKFKCLCLWNPVLDYDHTFLNPTLPWIVKRKGHMRNDLKTKGWTTLGSRNFKLGKDLFDEMEKTYPFEAMKKINIPTEIIHGDKDTYVPYEDSVNYFPNLQEESHFVTIEGGEHGFHDNKKHGQQANKETLIFFKKYL